MYFVSIFTEFLNDYLSINNIYQKTNQKYFDFKVHIIILSELTS